MSYPIANMLTQLKNAQIARHERVVLPFSKMKLDVAKVLKERDFIGDVDVKKRKARKAEIDVLDVKLKYGENGSGAISDVKILSKPSRRMYMRKDEIKKVRSGYGLLILSTPEGIMSGDDAKKKGIGGEIIAEVW